MKRRAIFITVEGVEGSGKSTQVRLLHRYLLRKGWDVVRTFEPGGTVLGKGIRRLLLGHKGRMSPEAETLLYMSSRAELVREVILPELKKGKIVISDRWLDATIAYQGFGAGVSRTWIRRLAGEAVLGVRPDLTLYLDLAAEKGLRRVKRRGRMDRIEKRPLAFHRRVRRGYLFLAKREKRFRLIPVTTVAATQGRIREAVNRFLLRRRTGRDG